ncbi:hypothetical protein ACHAW5_009665 [Stephanodiscus triporus]|uniref:Cadherin-like domain-containing protein n=1 Tax=Stephanodiscus triporus TaxID=2934178 RepID=A0ABD3N1Z5_9STRA
MATKDKEDVQFWSKGSKSHHSSKGSKSSKSHNDAHDVGEETIDTFVNKHTTLNDDMAETAQNTPVLISPLDNDENIPSYASLSTTQASNGTCTLQLFDVIYTPDQDFCGTDLFTYTIADSSIAYVATVTVNVACPPILNDDYAETMANTTISIHVLDNDEYVPPGAFGTITQPLNGTCIRDDVNILYTPNSDFCGVDQFTYTVTHPIGGADTATVTVLVLCPETTESDRPIANDDFATTSQGNSVVLFVLSNDIFPPGTTGNFEDPSHGVLVMGSSDLVYTPNVDFCGVDTFKYTLSNAQFSDTATVTIEIFCNNLQEVPSGEDTIGHRVRIQLGRPLRAMPMTCPESIGHRVRIQLDRPLRAMPMTCPESIGHRVADDTSGVDRPSGEDSAGPPLRAMPMTCPIGPLLEGNADDMSGVDRAIGGGYGWAAPRGHADDASKSDRPSGEDTVGPPLEGNADDMPGIERPLKLEDDFAEGNMNEALFIPVLVNDTIPGEAVGGFSDPKHGEIIEPTEDGLIYMPDTDFCGYDRFEYTVNTGSQVDSATVTVHIFCDSETFATPTFAPTEISTTDFTVDGGPDFIEDSTVGLLSLSCSTMMNDPVLKEIPSTDITFKSYGDHGDCSIKDSMIMYTPDEGFAGYDECTFSICDSANTCGPGVLTITVIPDAVAIEKTTLMESPISIAFEDLYDLSHTEVDIIYDPTDGNLTAGAEGTLLYTPNDDFSGTEVFKYSLCTVAEPVRCDESTITIVVVATENATIMKQSIVEKASNDITAGATSTVVSEAEEIEVETNAMPFIAVAAGVFGVVLALSGTAVYKMRKRGNSTDDDFRSTVKNTNSDDTEDTALTGNYCDNMRPPLSSLKIPYAGGNGNLSVTAFLTGEAERLQDPGSSKSRTTTPRSIFNNEKSVLFPLSPANSLFSPTHSVKTTYSLSSHMSATKSNSVEDVVDL